MPFAWTGTHAVGLGIPGGEGKYNQPRYFFDNADNHFDNQTMHFNALFCIFLYLCEDNKKPETL